MSTLISSNNFLKDLDQECTIYWEQSILSGYLQEQDPGLDEINHVKVLLYFLQEV